MAKKQKYQSDLTPPEKEATMMRNLDFQRACIARGIDFKLLVSLSTPALQDWFIRHYYDAIDNSRLDAFDEWREEIMKKRGKDEPFIRLGYVGEINEKTGEVLSIKKPKKFKKPKSTKKREKNAELGIWSGTKKELTYQCAKEGKSLEKTKKTVLEKFPDASEKSIGIWYKRFLKNENGG